MEVQCPNYVSLHGAMLNAVAHFLHRKECPEASEILRDNVSKFKYILQVMSLQNVSASERIKTFKWHLMFTPLRPNAHIICMYIK